jgi:hypothetical protein
MLPLIVEAFHERVALKYRRIVERRPDRFSGRRNTLAIDHPHGFEIIGTRCSRECRPRLVGHGN